jgi:glycosyltransferase involved in cell wall biosynthesis
MANIDFSIIIPVKNNIELLKRCISSIPIRNDIQIIIADDNSDSDQNDYEQYFLDSNHNLEVLLLKEGKGAGYARNMGMSKVKGRWVIFADSDDYFNNKFGEVMDRHKASIAEIIYFGVSCVFSDTKAKSVKCKRQNELVLSFLSRDPGSDENIRYFYTTPWGKMFSGEYLHKFSLKFEEIPAGNDILFSIMSGDQAKIIEADEEKIYCYTVRKGSITNTDNYDMLNSRYLATLRVNQYLTARGKYKHRRSIAYFLVKISRYGIRPLLQATKMLYKYKVNPLIGINNWILTVINIIKRPKMYKKYVTK